MNLLHSGEWPARRATVFHVMPESGNNRLLSHAVATNHMPAKCLKSPLQIKVFAAEIGVSP